MSITKSKKLSNGTSRKSPVQELKEEFLLRKPYLPAKWKKDYLDRFCDLLSPSELVELGNHLHNVDKSFQPQAPRLSVLNNIDILIEENNWKTDEHTSNGITPA